jgi:hypothetical protein
LLRQPRRRTRCLELRSRLARDVEASDAATSLCRGPDAADLQPLIGASVQ